jgi:hypothetical protein
MIFQLPAPGDPVDQGDIIDGCPLLSVAKFSTAEPTSLETKFSFCRVVVLTQTCDLVNAKVNRVVVAVVLDAQSLVDQKLLKAADIRGPIRAGRVYGWYFLPKSEDARLPESIVDFRQLHTVRLDLLVELCQQGHRLARIPPLYREHLAKHFADSYSRIGLPEALPTS